MVVAWFFSEKDRMCNEPKYKALIHSHIFRKQEYRFVEYWSKKYKLHFLVVKEDDSERCTRTWTAQVSFQRFQVSYLTTASPTVFSLFPHCTCYCVFTNCVLLFFFFFLCSLFRSRSYPVPHRGERVKQWTVHPRNFALFTLKDGFMLFINPGGYRGADKSLAQPTSRCILFDV